MGKHMVKLALPCSNSRFNASGTGREKKEKNGSRGPAYKYANPPVPNRLFSTRLKKQGTGGTPLDGKGWAHIFFSSCARI